MQLCAAGAGRRALVEARVGAATCGGAGQRVVSTIRKRAPPDSIF